MLKYLVCIWYLEMWYRKILIWICLWLNFYLIFEDEVIEYFVEIYVSLVFKFISNLYFMIKILNLIKYILFK